MNYAPRLGGELLWRDDFCRVVLVDDVDYPGFCRVILNAHVKEMSDLSEARQMPTDARGVCHRNGCCVQVLKPDKINLASLGNMTPHLHWHVIPRFASDRHFPQSGLGRAAARIASARPAQPDRRNFEICAGAAALTPGK